MFLKNKIDLIRILTNCEQIFDKIPHLIIGLTKTQIINKYSPQPTKIFGIR